MRSDSGWSGAGWRSMCDGGLVWEVSIERGQVRSDQMVGDASGRVCCVRYWKITTDLCYPVSSVDVPFDYSVPALCPLLSNPALCSLLCISIVSTLFFFFKVSFFPLFFPIRI